MTNLIKNYLYTATYQILLLVLPIVTLPYVSRVLLPKGIGLNAWIYSINSYFVMFAVLGLTVYAQREISIKREDKLGLSTLFWKIEFSSICMGSISLVCYFVFLVIYDKYTVYLSAYSLSILAVIFDVSWLFSGLEKFRILAFRNIIVKLLAVISIFIFVHSSHDLLIYMFIQSGSILISNLSIWPQAIKIVGLPKRIIFSEIFEPINGSFQLFIPQISISVYLTLNKILLGIFSTSEKVGFFDSSDKIIRMIFSLFIAISTVVMPRIASMYAKNKISTIINLLKSIMTITLFIVFPLVFILYLFAPILVTTLFGSSYIEMVEILRLMLLMLPVAAIANILGNQILIPLNKIKEYTMSIVYGALINLIIEIPLIILFKANGAAIAVVLSEVVVMSLQIRYCRKILGIKKLFKPSIHILKTGSILFVCSIMVALLNFSTGINILISIVLTILYVLFNYEVLTIIYLKIVNK